MRLTSNLAAIPLSPPTCEIDGRVSGSVRCSLRVTPCNTRTIENMTFGMYWTRDVNVLTGRNVEQHGFVRGALRQIPWAQPRFFRDRTTGMRTLFCTWLPPYSNCNAVPQRPQNLKVALLTLPQVVQTGFCFTVMGRPSVRPTNFSVMTCDVSSVGK
jgi:hypothetical protein